MTYDDIKRGEVYLADLTNGIGSEQTGLRPVVIIQNNIGNRFSPTVIVAAITSQLLKTRLPTHVELFSPEAGLDKNSIVLLEQVRTIDKLRLQKKLGVLSPGLIYKLNESLKVSLGLESR